MVTSMVLWRPSFGVSVRRHKSFEVVQLLVFDGSSRRGDFSRMVVPLCPNFAQLFDNPEGVKP
jgi:hypothetical protein